ncbi:MAG: hypothetical protein WCJ69_02935 [Betaproteobacteria bacterium]
MADPRAAARVIASLPTGVPLVALETLSGHLDGVREAVGLGVGRVFEIVEQIDRAAKPFHQPLTQEFLEAGTDRPGITSRIAHVESNFWDCLARAYRMLLESHETGNPAAQALRRQIPLAAARSIRAFNLHLKWNLMRYAPVNASLWGSLARVYSIAESHQVATAEVEVYPGPWGLSTVRREMLKALMLSISSTDALPRSRIEIAERICAQFSEFFLLQNQLEVGAHFRFDIGEDAPPARAIGAGAPTATERFFGPGGAAPHLRKLAEDIQACGAVPSTVNLGGTYPMHAVLQVLEHLSRYWSPTPPVRRENRRNSGETIEVVRGFKNVLAAIDAGQFSWGGETKACEEWSVLDESPTGLGAVLPAGLAGPLSIGALVGLRYTDEGAAWAVGIVRRIGMAEQARRRAGLELLSRGAMRVELSPRQADGRPSGPAAARVSALLLPSASDNSIGRITVRLAVPPRVFYLRGIHSIMLFGADYLLAPKEPIEEADDYVIGEYRLLPLTD